MGYGQQIDTLYYDREWKGVDLKDFADYYRVTMTPEDPNYPKRFRDYFMSGKLEASGNFISIDKFDDSKSIFDGKCVNYYENGKVSVERNFLNGTLHGLYQAYYENGQLAQQINFANGLKDGIYREYAENGTPKITGVYKEDKVNGKVAFYNSVGKLDRTCEFMDDVLHGESVSYHPNETPSQIIPFQHGKIEGKVQFFDDAGVPIGFYHYKEDLRVGNYEYSEDGRRHKGVYKLMKCEGDSISDFQISLNVSTASYNVKTKLNWGGILSASALDLMLGNKEKFQKDKYQHVTAFDIQIYNKSDHIQSCCIDRIGVYYVDGSSYSNNMHIPSKEALEIYEVAGLRIAGKAQEVAQENAANAATRSSQNFGGGVVTNNINASAYGSSYTSSDAAALGAVVGADNSGYYGGAVGAGIASASSNTSAYASANANHVGTSFNASASSTTDGYIQYQVYQQERVIADKIGNDVDRSVRDLADKLSYTQFTIKPNSIANKHIAAKMRKGKDGIMISFFLNGVEYTATWLYEEIDNSITKK